MPARQNLGPRRPHKHEDATKHDFGMPLLLSGLETRRWDYYVYVAFWARACV